VRSIKFLIAGILLFVGGVSQAVPIGLQIDWTGGSLAGTTSVGEIDISNFSGTGIETFTALSSDLLGTDIPAPANGKIINSFSLNIIRPLPFSSSNYNLVDAASTRPFVSPIRVQFDNGVLTDLFDAVFLDTSTNDFIQIGNGGLATDVLSSSSDIGTISSTGPITAEVPEPSTYLLMGLGLLGLTYVRRRKTL